MCRADLYRLLMHTRYMRVSNAHYYALFSNHHDSFDAIVENVKRESCAISPVFFLLKMCNECEFLSGVSIKVTSDYRDVLLLSRVIAINGILSVQHGCVILTKKNTNSVQWAYIYKLRYFLHKILIISDAIYFILDALDASWWMKRSCIWARDRLRHVYVCVRFGVEENEHTCIRDVAVFTFYMFSPLYRSRYWLARVALLNITFEKVNSSESNRIKYIVVVRAFVSLSLNMCANVWSHNQNRVIEYIIIDWFSSGSVLN